MTPAGQIQTILRARGHAVPGLHRLHGRDHHPDGDTGQGDGEYVVWVLVLSMHMSQMLYAGQSDRENVTFFTDF